jgi:DNA (cytosine-5)-methyltransferase 1
MTGPTVVDLFCGAGGLSLGLRDAGFAVLVGADNDALSVETHTANIGGLGYTGDLSDPRPFVRQLRRWGIRRVDLVAGGVPCQPFSRAGRAKIRSLVRTGNRPEHDPRADLWESFLEVVKVLRPRAVLLENVPDLAAWNEGAVLQSLSDSLRELGYATDAVILDAHRYMVPQHRARLFLVGRRAGIAFEWPEPARGEVTVRDAIGDLPPVPPAHRLERTPYSLPATTLQRRLRRDVAVEDAAWIDDHITRDVRADDAEAYAILRPGRTYTELPERLRRYRADIFHDKYNRLAWDGLSRSITAHLAKDGYWYIHPEQDRTLSVREAARLQTFPDWFRFSGRPSRRYHQIGNAVPPLLAEAIGAELAAALRRHPRRGRPVGSGPRFRDRLLTWQRKNARRYPWRAGADPWRVLIAEVCLRRTRADQVVPVFRTLSDLAPTPQAMLDNAAAVIEAMRSLGLRWRAKNMLAIAEELVAKYRGQVPDSVADLLSLPGVGDYVAHAVLVFGHGRKAVIVDTNTERIATRVRRRRVHRRWQVRLDLQHLASSEGPDAAFNFALLDLGALVCRVTRPLCDSCPVRRQCDTYLQAPGD